MSQYKAVEKLARAEFNGNISATIREHLPTEKPNYERIK